jgi:hypothetical protein
MATAPTASPIGPAPGQDAQRGQNLSTYGTPVFDQGMTFREVGQTGLRQYSGWVREEFLPQLQGRQAARVYREMSDNDATIGAMLFAVTQTMRKIDWRVKPADDTPEALAEAQFADSLRFDMSHTWEDFIAEALSMLPYGFAPHEIVYKRRLGRQPNDPTNTDEETPSSQFDDGRIGLRKLPIRGQDTVIKWFFGDNGEIEGLTQQPYTGPTVNIPIEKLLLFRPSAHKGNPEGRSMLRNSYRSWFFLKRFEEEEAIFYERMSGVPCMFVPQELMDAAAANDPNAIAQVNAYKKMVTNTKIGEQMGLLLPSNTWPTAAGAQGSVRMYEFQLITPASRGGAAVDSDKVIHRHQLNMLMTMLADFIALGHAAHGTQSLAENKVDMFFQAIEGWINAIAAVVNRYLLPRVWQLNALDPALMPEYVPDLAQRIDLGAISDFVLKLAQSGMQMFPDDDLENYLRDAAGMPDKGDTAYADNDQTNPQDLKTTDLQTPDDLAPSVEQRTASPGFVQVPSAEAIGTGQVKKPSGGPTVNLKRDAAQAVIKMLEAAAERRARQHRARA